MTTLLDQPHQFPNIATPLVQHLVPFLGFDEIYNARRSVNLGIDSFRSHEGGKEFLGFWWREVEERRETGESDSGVV